MVSKENLQDELNSFNKQLEEHLSGIGVDLLDDTSFNTSSLSGDNSETMLLLTQSLKDIRMEMNLMRKHMASDTEVMLKSLMNAQQKQFQEEMRAFQERTFKILKVFDPSILKEISSEISRISNDQTSIKSDLSDLKESIHSEKNSQNAIDLKVEIEPLFMSLKSQQVKLESQVETLFTKEKNKLENFELILKDTLDALENSLSGKQEIILSSLSTLDSKTRTNITKLSKKVDSIESDQENYFNQLTHDVSSLSKRLGIQKQELLQNSNESEKLIFQKISELEDNILESEESLGSKFNKKILQLDDKLNITKDEVLMNVSQTENLLFKKSSDLEEEFLSSKDKIDSLNTKVASTFEELSSKKNFSKKQVEKEVISINKPLKVGKVIDLENEENIPKIREIDNKEKLLDIESRLRKLSQLK